MIRKLFAISFCLLASLGGCATETGAPTEDLGEAQQGVSDNACRWRCNTCAPGSACIQTCEAIGQCGRHCNVLGLCAPGYEWDENACTCLPSRGEACGSVTCPTGMVCCNESCGICTEPGGFCTEQYCTAF